MKILLYTLLLVFSVSSSGQSVLSGRITDEKGAAVRGASVSLENTIDGGTTDSAGYFRFSTEEKGAQTLVATEATHAAAGMPVNTDKDVAGILLRMKTVSRNLDEVVITAGAFEASNNKSKAVLTTMDIVTTAGANADVVKAIQTLPGTQQQGTETGLFVRGGDASEAAVVVDQMVSQNAFFAGAPGVATRSRFSPFQFNGVSFSSGGYSTRYGQALSSVLELNTLDLPEKSTVNLGLNMAGVYASGSKLWKNSGGDAAISYNNLSPFYGIANANIDFDQMPEGINGSARYAWKPNKDGLFKVMVNSSGFRSITRVADPDSADQQLRFGIKTQTHYTNASYRQYLGNKWNLYAAAAYSYNQEDVDYKAAYAGAFRYRNKDNRAQLRLEAKRMVSTRFSITAGTELQHYTFSRAFDSLGYVFQPSFTETSLAAYLEAEWSPTKKIAIRPGVRYEHSALLGQDAIAPRLALALRTSTYGQVAVAGGLFYQNPDHVYLLYGYRPGFQQAIHYIASYQWSRNSRTLRVEGYYKDYKQLVREHMSYYDPNPYRYYVAGSVDNSGFGYARGFELFWRDRKLVRNLDYWISYSYIDTRRLYKNFIAEASPSFISDHNLNLISKYYIEKLDLQINTTYSYATGRPYYNIGNPEFLGDRTPEYHNLSFTLNYLTHIRKWFTVIYAGVDNVTNQENVFGYRYSGNGSRRSPIRPALYRSVFIGANFSLSEFNRDEL